MSISISIIITAYNEEKNIRSAFLDIQNASINLNLDYEIIIINDASKDNTKNEIDKIISEFDNVKLINNNKNQGPGESFNIGVKKAIGEVVLWISGDGDTKAFEYLKHINLFKKYHLICFYFTNPEERILFRRFLTFTFTFILNLFFLMNLKYFNGPTAIKKDIYLTLIPRSNRFFFAAESKIKVIKKKYLYVEIPIKIEAKQQNGSIRDITTPLNPKNLFDVIKSFFRVFYEIYLSKEFKETKKIN